jgi:hypothetical protein
MDERWSFWKCYKRSIYALGAAIIISISVTAVFGETNWGRQGHTNRIILLSSTLILLAMLAIGLIFCGIKTVILVWTTSSKIAKLLRTDDRQLVFAMRRKMYAYISVIAIGSVISVTELFLLGVFYVSGITLLLQVSLHFLEFVRLGVKNLDEYELREKSISDAVPSEGVSQMASIEPMSPSELEPEIEGKHKKWFK